jgi:hypothetical protein
MIIRSYGTSSPVHLDKNGNQIHSNEEIKKQMFYIGFEVEKNFFVTNDGREVASRRDEVHSSNLFCNFETDSSCGVEAVTNILPLGGVKSEERKSMFKLFESEKKLINESGADGRCGGHITVSCTQKGWTKGYNLYAAMRQNFALIYAMFPHRLAKIHCERNAALLMLPDWPKYSPVNIKQNCIEIRLPNAVRTVEQMRNRYDLIFKLMKYSITEVITFKQLKDECKSNLMRIYNRDAEKVGKVLKLADDFHSFLITRQLNPTIERYFNREQVQLYLTLFQE